MFLSSDSFIIHCIYVYTHAYTRVHICCCIHIYLNDYAVKHILFVYYSIHNIHIYMRTYAFTHTHTHTHRHIYIPLIHYSPTHRAHKCTNVHTHIQTRTHTHTHTHSHTYTYIYLRTYIHIPLLKCITYTHPLIPTPVPATPYASTISPTTFPHIDTQTLTYTHTHA